MTKCLNGGCLMSCSAEGIPGAVHMKFDYRWTDVTQVSKPWDNMRWITIEPSWIVAKHLLSGGWKWSSGGSCKTQGELLVRRVQKELDDQYDIKAHSRGLVKAHQGIFCLLDIFNTWGVTQEFSTTNDKATEILHSPGYKELLTNFDKLHDLVDALQQRKIEVALGMFNREQFLRDWVNQTPEAKVLVLRELVRRLQRASVKIQKWFPEATKTEIFLASSNALPEVSSALRIVDPQTLVDYLNTGAY